MQTLYSDLNVETRLISKFTEIRDQLNCYLDSGSNLSISEDGPMTHRDILELFIFGDLAHANDSTQEANYRSISQTAFFPLFQVDFTKTFNLLLSALNAVKQINSEALDSLRRGGTLP